MSRKANPTVIGAFVVGAVVIAVAAVIILTGGQLFQKKLDVVMHFDGSVKGLSVGAPVSFRGVQVGTVKGIEIVVSPDQDARIPVTVEIDPRRHAEAVENITEAGLAAFVDFRLGDGHDIVPALEGPFDFVFSDADKDWYVNYFDAVYPKQASSVSFG